MVALLFISIAMVSELRVFSVMECELDGGLMDKTWGPRCPPNSGEPVTILLTKRQCLNI